MHQWTAYAPPNSDKPHAIVNQFGGRREVPAIKIDQSKEIPVRRFESADVDSALQYLLAMHRSGVRGTDPAYKFVKPKVWRHRGAGAYLDVQVFIQGVSQLVVDKVKNNDQVRGISALLNQLTERYLKANLGNATAILPPFEADKVKLILKETKKHRDRLHALAAAADDMIAEAYAAFGWEPPEYDAVVVSTFGKPVEPAIAPIAPAENPATTEQQVGPTTNTPPENESKPADPGAIAATEPGIPGATHDHKPPDHKRHNPQKHAGAR